DGRYHSKWMNMIYPRLFLARNLLQDDGVIFISIDDNELNNLKTICNEVFGEENFVGLIIHKNNSNKNQAKLVSISTEYVLIFAKSKINLSKNEWREPKKNCIDIVKIFRAMKEKGFSNSEIESEIRELYKRPKYSHLSRWNKVDDKGVFKDENLSREGGPKSYTIINPQTGDPCPIPPRGWGKSYEDLLDLQSKDLIWYGDPNTSPGWKYYLGENTVSIPDSFVYFDNSTDTRWIKSVFGRLVFDFPKPLDMITHFIRIATEKTDLVLDFFSGSSTTAHAVMSLNQEDCGNRKYIMVQLPEPCDEESEAYKAGYRTIAEIGKARIKKVIEKLPLSSGQLSLSDNALIQDMGFKVFKLAVSSFKPWDSNVMETEGLAKQLQTNIDHIKPGATDEDVLYEILLKAGYPLTTKIETFKLADKTVYSIDGDTLLICLDRQLTKEVITEMAQREPQRVVCLDTGFINNDQLKTNAVQIMKSHDVKDFYTV
ncbi:MAG: site-specific DNA-methyltransferase, partial [Cyanobacteria bacterium]|nr:site-specific DNA-methyltransferase [Cyanobacteriota bacterium]